MIDSLLRGIPLPAYRPLRQAVFDFDRRNPIRIVSTMVLKRAARAYSGHLKAHLSEVRPLDRPDISFEPSDSMVMDAVYWLGVRGYEGIVARVWTELCGSASSVLEIGGNVGLFAVLGGRAAHGRYTVVEPVPAVAATLRANLARNAITRVELLEGAVVPGAAPRSVTLNLPSEGRGMPVGAHLVSDVEVAYRSSQGHITVPGLPIRLLAQGRDLIKIDAEGIEAALLADVREHLVATRPTLMLEVLPEATGLAILLAGLATEAGYRIHILPEYGSDVIVTVPPDAFHAGLPRVHNSKDVVLSVGPLA